MWRSLFQSDFIFPCETTFVAIKLKFTFFFVNGHNRVCFFFGFSVWCRRNPGPWLCPPADSLTEIQSRQSHPESQGWAVRDTLPKIKQWPHENSNRRNFVIFSNASVWVSPWEKRLLRSLERSKRDTAVSCGDKRECLWDNYQLIYLCSYYTRN